VNPRTYLDGEIAAMTPSASDRSAASLNRAVIEGAVRSGLDAYRIFETGSWSHGTALRIWSDVDYFVSLSHARPARSYDDMLRLKQVLADRLGGRARSVSVSRPGVRIDWVDGPDTEVIPAHITDDDDWWIPDPQGDGWIKSSPLKHNEYVDVTQYRQPRTKEFVRLVKLWKYRRSVPITSLYLELRAAKYVRENPPLHMIIDAAGFFRSLYSNQLADMNDPSRFDGRRISATSVSSRAAALELVLTAHVLTELAEENLSSNDTICEAYLRSFIAYQ